MGWTGGKELRNRVRHRRIGEGSGKLAKTAAIQWCHSHGVTAEERSFCKCVCEVDLQNKLQSREVEEC